MSTTLPFIDRLLISARNLQRLGREYDALRILRRLAGFRNLPSDTAEETQARLGELYLNQRRYRQARRHLAAALRHQPENAGYHYLMARAEYAEDTGDPHQAAEHYRQSLALDPNQPGCRTEYGRLALEQEEIEEGLTVLYQAVEQAPNDPETVRPLVEGLSQTGRIGEAQRVLQAARFRNPRDPRFLRLWRDFQYQQLHAEQAAACLEADRSLAEQGPTLLPFRRPAQSGSGFRGRRYRRDNATPPAPPHTSIPTRISDQKQA